jgi:ribosomal protein L11 methyltransferase
VDRLLDMGCGSGVLGLAGAALGVPRVVSLDISRVAAQVTGENARKNNLSGPLIVVQGSSECVKATFDLVVANLPWEVQMNKVSECCRLVARQGRLILSGFRDDRENPLLESYLERGWSLKQRLVRDFYHPELPLHLSFTWVAWLLVGPVAPRPAPFQKGSRLRLSSLSAQ